MRTFLLASFVILITGCAASTTTTTGPIDRSMDSAQPYIYSCDCSESEAFVELKRYLVSTGWSVDSEDEKAGVIAATKSLSPSEKVQTTALGEELTGESTAGQTGRFSFQLTRGGDTTGVGILTLEMDGWVKIAEVSEGSPADSAGLEKGWYLRSVDGQSTRGMTSQEAAALLSRRSGESHTLEVSDTPNAEPRSVDVTVGQVPGYTLVQMRGQITATVNQNQGFTTEQSQQSGYVIRGYPMMVVHGRRIHRQTKLELENPQPSTLPTAEGRQ